MKGGLSGLVQSVFLAVGIWREDQVPGPKFKPEGFRLEECVSPRSSSANFRF